MITSRFFSALACLMLAATGTPAAAQDEPDRLKITPHQFESHVEALDLTAAQRTAAETMYAEYAREFDDAWKMYSDLQRWLWTPHDDWVVGRPSVEFEDRLGREGRTLDQRWQRGARSLETSYFDRLRSITIGREEMIERLRRKHLRERVLPRDPHHQPAGAGVDVIALTQEFDPELAENAPVKNVLAEYEMALARALREYEEHVITRRWRMDRTAEAVRHARDAGEDATSAIEARIDVIVEYERDMTGLWQLNAQTLDRIISLLPSEQQPAFGDAVFLSLHAYLRPEKGPAPDEAFQKALQRNNLSPQQRDDLVRLQASWRAARDAALPDLQRTCMRTFDADLSRPIWRLILTDQREHASQQTHALEDEWKQAYAQWQQKCAEALAAIEIATDEGETESP